MTAKLIYRGKEIHLTPEQVVTILGRHRDNPVIVNDKAASRQHCRIVLNKDGSHSLHDMGSANGTKLNGQKITDPKVLNDGDLIVIGESHIKYLSDEFEDEADDDATMMMRPPPKPMRPATDDGTATGPSPFVPDSTPKPASKPAPQKRDPSTATFEGSKLKKYQPEDLIGKTISGYRLDSIILTTSVGTIYQGVQLSLNRQVAVKVLSEPAVRTSATYADDLIDQARRAGRVSHEGIVQIHETGFNEGLLWYSMEYVAGDIIGRPPSPRWQNRT